MPQHRSRLHRSIRTFRQRHGQVGGLASSWRADTRDGRARAQLRAAGFRAVYRFACVDATGLGLLDAGVITVAWVVALFAGFEGDPPTDLGGQPVLYVVLPVATQLIVNRISGLYGPVWKYASIEEATRVVVAVGGGAALSFIELVILAQATDATLPVMTMPPIAALLILLGCGGIRFQARLFALERQNVRGKGHVRTIIVGTDRAGAALARELHADEANSHLSLWASSTEIAACPIVRSTACPCWAPPSRAHLPGARCAPGAHRSPTERDATRRRPSSTSH